MKVDIGDITLKEIIEKYPKIFQKNEHGMYVESCDCPKGWLHIVDSLCMSIQDYIDNVRTSKINLEYVEGSKYDANDIKTHEFIMIPPLQVQCVQIKEKFGGLRFYVNNSCHAINGMISFAESLCYHTCMKCGSMKDVTQTKTTWISTLCKECAKK